MFNANTVLDLLIEALREGGEVRVREFAKTYAGEQYAYVEIDEASVDAVVTDVLAALNDFDKERALRVVEEAPERIRATADDDEDEDEDEDEDDETSEDSGDLASRVTALEKGLAELREVATSRGLL